MSIDQAAIEKNLGYQFSDSQLLMQALCHKSYSKENPECPHNEKLEFLGDAVLDVVISDLLMEKYREDQEGSLSRKRASVVNEDRLSSLAQQMQLDQFLLIGQRESKNNLRENPRIRASVFEAIVGAIYKDSNFQAAFSWLQIIFDPVIDEAFSNHDFERDYKTRFQEWVQDKHKLTPNYKVIKQTGPDHERVFEVEVFVGETSWGQATGASKKTAAQNAAKQALAKVEE